MTLYFLFLAAQLASGEVNYDGNEGAFPTEDACKAAGEAVAAKAMATFGPGAHVVISCIKTALTAPPPVPVPTEPLVPKRGA